MPEFIDLEHGLLSPPSFVPHNVSILNASQFSIMLSSFKFAPINDIRFSDAIIFR